MKRFLSCLSARGRIRLGGLPIVCCLLFLSSCNSFLSIEKRQYRNGYHVEWFAKSKTISQIFLQKEKIALESDSGSVDIVNQSALLVENETVEKNILIEKSSPKITRIVFRKDTIIESKGFKKANKKGISMSAGYLIAGIVCLIVGTILIILLLAQPFYAFFVMVIFYSIGFRLLLIALVSFILKIANKRKEKKQQYFLNR